MGNNINAEAHILDRIMYLLEENSVTNLMQNDTNFAKYISDLYSDISAKSIKLRDLNVTSR